MSNITLLIAEPDVLVRTALAAYLRDCGYLVLEAGDGGEALTLLQNANLSIDLVLAAVDLGGSTSGFILAQWARSHMPNVKVLLAGSVEKSAAAAAELCDQGPLLKRPYDHQIVVDTIKRLMAARRG